MTVNDGDTIDFMVRAVIGEAEQGASASQLRTMDFSPPTVAMVSQTIAGFTTPADQVTATYGIDDDVDQLVGTGPVSYTHLTLPTICSV